MKKVMLLVGFLMVAGATPLAAQAGREAQCAGGSAFLDDACQKGLDILKLMSPQLGIAVAGGNATLAQGGTLGGLPHFAITVRANALQGIVPKVDAVSPGVGGATASDYETQNQILGLPQVDAAVGLFKGLPLGLTNVGGVDLLISANYLPNVSTDQLELSTTGSALKFGYGLRVGLLQESIVLPGVSATYMQRDLPEINLMAVSADDSISVEGFGVKTNAWRLVASKNFLVFGLAAGLGQDRYTSKADLFVAVNEPGIPTALTRGRPFPDGFEQKLTRTNYFANAYFNMLVMKVVGEVGMVQGGSIDTYNTFSGKRADDSRLYGSVGLRLGF
jgi:hypothetical protein